MNTAQLHPPAASQTGFTLIEVLIVVSLSVLLMLAASSLFMTFLIGNTKTTTMQLVKAEGEYALSQMEFLLRNAIQLLPNSEDDVCVPNMDEIRFKSIDDGITTLTREIDSSDGNRPKIASNSGIYLTSGAVDLVAGPVFNCSQTSDGLSQYITITFQLRKGTPGIDQARDIVTQDFSAGVNLRSY